VVPQIGGGKATPTGQFNLGWMYENGRGIPHDLAQARQWYQRAAAQGLGYAQEAMLRLGQQ
jgi:FOG: TPR repeat, SEL1 subfamily